MATRVPATWGTPPTEDELQKMIVRALVNEMHKDVVLFHVPNGGRRGKVEAARFKALGVVPGVADLILFHRSHAFCMELKRPAGGKVKAGVQSEHQLAFEQRCLATGIPYAVVSSYEEARAWAGRWGLLHFRNRSTFDD